MRFLGLPGRWMLAFAGLVAGVGVLGAVVTPSASAQPNGTCSYTEQEDVPAAMRDGTIQWAARLPKSDGRVGMYGFSYPGTTQYQTAILPPPHLVTIVPAMSSDDYHDGWTYEGGALDLSFADDWPLRTIAASAVRSRYPDGGALVAEMN